MSNEFHRRLPRSAFDNIVLSLPTMKTTDPKAPPFSMYDELVIQVGSEFAVGWFKNMAQDLERLAKLLP